MKCIPVKINSVAICPAENPNLSYDDWIKTDLLALRKWLTHDLSDLFFFKTTHIHLFSPKCRNSE